MAKQNIYDNETFFEGYKKIRDNEINANNLFEIPALFSMIPELNGKKVLDLGCGFYRWKILIILLSVTILNLLY